MACQRERPLWLSHAKRATIRDGLPKRPSVKVTPALTFLLKPASSSN